MQLKHSEGLKKLNPKYMIIKSQNNWKHCWELLIHTLEMNVHQNI